MNLSKTFERGAQHSIFELLAAFGLAINALVVSAEAPLSGQYLHGASIVMFGVGAIGLAMVLAIPYAEQQDFLREPIAVYGGLILAIVSSSVFGFLAATGRFNNLLAVLLLTGFAGVYLLFWKRAKTYKRSDYAFH